MSAAIPGGVLAVPVGTAVTTRELRGAVGGVVSTLAPAVVPDGVARATGALLAGA